MAYPAGPGYAYQRPPYQRAPYQHGPQYRPPLPLKGLRGPGYGLGPPRRPKLSVLPRRWTDGDLDRIPRRNDPWLQQQRQAYDHLQYRREKERSRLLSGAANHWRSRTTLLCYDEIKRLGCGGLSESIKVVRDRQTRVLRVIKRVSRRARPREELEVLKRIPKGVHLNYMVEYAWSPNRAEVSFVLEHCDLGDLGSKIDAKFQDEECFSEDFAWHVLRDIGKALAFLHHGNVDVARESQTRKGWDTMCHLDIKPANIFLSSVGTDGLHPRLVLGDFGCAVTLLDVVTRKEHPEQHRHGTKDWFPPESLSEVVGSRGRSYGRPTDIWQLGAVVAALCRLTQRPDRKQLFEDYPTPCGSRYGRRLNGIVSACVRFDRKRRPGARDIVQEAMRR